MRNARAFFIFKLYMRKIFLFAIVFSLFLSLAFNTDISAQNTPKLTEAIFNTLIKKLSPVTATILEINGNSLLLDQGTIHGIQPGDLFQVYSKGKPFAGSKGGRPIGYLKKPSSIIQVTKTKSHRSWAKVISGKGPFFKGMPATRFSDIKSVIIRNDPNWYSQADEKKIMSSLSSLQWKTPLELGTRELNNNLFGHLDVDVILLLGPSSIKLYTPGPYLLYEHNIASASHVNSGIKQPSIKETPASLLLLGLTDKKIIGKLPDPAIQILVDDLDKKKGEEIIYLLPSGIYIAPFKRAGKTVSYIFSRPSHPVSFSISPGNNWIAVNITMDSIGMKSILLRYEDGIIKKIQDDINLWLYFKNTGATKKDYVLLGQSFDNVSNFGAKIFKLKAEENGLEYEKAISLPPGSNIANSFFCDLNGNKLTETIVIKEPSKISIFESNKLIWSSRDEKTDSETPRTNDTAPVLVLDEWPKDCVVFVVRDNQDLISRLCWTGEGYEIFNASASLDGLTTGIFIADDQLFFSSSNNNETLIYSAGKIQEHH